MLINIIETIISVIFISYIVVQPKGIVFTALYSEQFLGNARGRWRDYFAKTGGDKGLRAPHPMLKVIIGSPQISISPIYYFS